MKFIVSADELLRPVVSVGDVADADLRIGAAEDVGAVTLAVHPARAAAMGYYGRRISLPGGYGFSRLRG